MYPCFVFVLECNCSSLGSRNVPGVPFLDCIRDETINVTGMVGFLGFHEFNKEFALS